MAHDSYRYGALMPAQSLALTGPFARERALPATDLPLHCTQHDGEPRQLIRLNRTACILKTTSQVVDDHHLTLE